MKRSLPLLLALIGWATLSLRAAEKPVRGTASAGPRAAQSDDGWYSWRGPRDNGVSPDRDLPDRFSLDRDDPNSNLVWSAPYGCRSTPIIMNHRVYIINHAGDTDLTLQERTMCLNADTGQVVWQHKYNVFFTDIVKVRLGWTSPVGDPDTGNVYVESTAGLFFCYDRDGKILWQRSLTEEFGRISGYGGRITNPMIDGNTVVIGMLNASWGSLGRGDTRWLALDKRTGEVIWWSSSAFPPKNSFYSTPVAGVIGGQRLLVAGGGDGMLHAIKANTGEPVWTYPLGTGAINPTPIIEGDLVYAMQGTENPDNNIQGRIVCLDGSVVNDGKPKVIWKVDGIRARYASPALHEGKLYIADEEAKLFCLDAKTGKTLWKISYGRNAKGSPVWADGKIYVGDVNGSFHIIPVSGAKPKRAHFKQFFPDAEINGSAAVAYGRVYFGTSTGMYCIGKKNHNKPPARLPPVPKEPPANPDARPAFLQVLPADVTVHPGESVTFKVRAFDNKGRFLKEVTDVTWDLPAPPPPPNSKLKPPALRGTVKGGKLTVAKPVPNQQGEVAAKGFGIFGTARVRVAPVLPYKQNFEKIPVGAPVAGWVNCAGKFVVQEMDGKKVLMKTAVIPSPLVSRANTYIGTPEMKDYTIAADVMGTEKRKSPSEAPDRSDAGIVANRYTLELVGNTGQLRLVSYDAIPRVDRSVTFPWKVKTWYRLKLTVKVQDGRGLIQGKVWPRGEKEPGEWTIEFEDPIPNTEGAPALYGLAAGVVSAKDPGAPSYFDNVVITPNKK